MGAHVEARRRTQPVPFQVLHHAYRAGEIFAYWMNGVNGRYKTDSSRSR